MALFQIGPVLLKKLVRLVGGDFSARQKGTDQADGVAEFAEVGFEKQPLGIEIGFVHSGHLSEPRKSGARRDSHQIIGHLGR